METRSITYKHSNISYLQFGKGDHLVFCFHGYGEDAKTFAFLEKVLGNEFTFIALDFPFHGFTKWKEDLLLSLDDLLEIMNKISSSKSFSIVGYSMGGKVALKLLQIIPERIEKIILLAPDGLHNNFWYNISTQTLIGNKLFAFSMNHPFWMFGMMKLFISTRLINKSISNFVHYYLDDKESRLILYKRWTTMRKFSPDIHLLKNIVFEKKILIRMLFGKYDRVILTKHGLQFQKKIESFVTVIELEAGHQLLKPKYTDDIAALFRS